MDLGISRRAPLCLALLLTIGGLRCSTSEPAPLAEEEEAQDDDDASSNEDPSPNVNGADASTTDPECQTAADCFGIDDVCLEGECLRCGPARARVNYIYDGDTLVLEDGERIRFLLVNAPEVANAYTGAPAECYGDTARDLTRSLLLNQTIDLEYDIECRDRFDRLLAWVSLDGLDINAHLLERGAVRLMYVSPNGGSRYQQYKQLEREAKESGIGLWAECP
ncbi:MAG: thermonuclease family protein [Myxococcales bacterium]|jgi:micrococcal nuclease|nr:thermonuclease family protein [Myxococcales bacterium]